MSKQVLVISTSPRKGGNSDVLADEFARGAREAGHNVEKICLSERRIEFCRGCLACQRTGACVLQDDANDIMARLIQADALAFATPIYFYEMSGQMKTLLDRSNPAFASDYRFRNIYLLAAAADADEAAMDGAVQGLRGWIACFANAKLSGVVRGTGATAPGDIRAIPAALQAAYQMGKAV